jgi:hypothetical protein
MEFYNYIAANRRATTLYIFLKRNKKTPAKDNFYIMKLPEEKDDLVKINTI